MRKKARAWSLISISKRRQYGGNLGYTDDPVRMYRYDNSVANSRQVTEGDFVILRDRSRLIGVGIIETIVEKDGDKKRLRCPKCNIPNIKERHTISPRWRCNNGHTFPNPSEEIVSVTRFEARYGNSFVPAGSMIPASVVRAAALRPSAQLSIGELDPEKLESVILSKIPLARVLFSEFVQSLSNLGEESISDGEEILSVYSLSMTERRERVLRSILERRGQMSFRRKLVRRYGTVCMISGCQLLDVLEAAHIWPYRGPSDNHVDNGLLLRADLHTLFDLDLLGIHPVNHRVSLASTVESAGYSCFIGAKLFIRGNQVPSQQALTARWNVFCRNVEAAPN